MAYSVEGRLLEACSCGGPCPCWVGDDPDGGKCDGMLCYHYDKGEINGVNVSGLTAAFVALIPGNILKGNWKVAALVDSKARPEQKQAILAMHTGKLGGPLAEWASTTRRSISTSRKAKERSASETPCRPKCSRIPTLRGVRRSWSTAFSARFQDRLRSSARRCPTRSICQSTT